MTELAKCPKCGIKTIPDHESLTFEEMLCDTCFDKNSNEGAHIYSDEGLLELCRSNEYEFAENGEFR